MTRSMEVSLTSPLFRQEALTYQRAQFFGELMLVSPLQLKWLAVIGALAIAGFVALMGWTSYPRTTIALGRIVPANGVAKITIPQDGRVRALAVTEGARVQKGAVLAWVSSDIQTLDGVGLHAKTSYELAKKRQMISERQRLLLEGIELKRQDFRKRKESASNELKTLAEEEVYTRERLRTFEVVEQNFRKLRDESFVSDGMYQPKLGDVKQQQIALQALKRRVLEVQRDLDQLNSQTQQAEADYRLSYAAALDQSHDLSIQETEAASRQEIAITSPIDGIVTDLQTSVGQNLSKNSYAMSIIPSDSVFQAHLFVPAENAILVRPGQPVVIRYGVPSWTKYPALLGNVSSITANTIMNATDRGSSTSSQVYLVVVTLNVIPAGLDSPSALRAGIPLNARIVTGQKRLYEWFLDPLDRAWASI
jgi:membrane fusion protein